MSTDHRAAAEEIAREYEGYGSTITDEARLLLGVLRALLALGDDVLVIRQENGPPL